MFKKFITGILVLSLAIGALTGISAFAADDTSAVWSGSIAALTEGDGSPNDPYLVTSAEQLAWLVRQSAKTTKGKYYRLTKNIILNDVTKANYVNGYIVKDSADFWSTAKQWPSGATDDWKFTIFGEFAGNFDGDGYTVYGMVNTWAPNGYWGLFGTLAENATVKNVNIDSAFYMRDWVTSWSRDNSYAAGIAGKVNGSNVTVKNCTVYRTTLMDGAGGWANAAGIIGVSSTNKNIVVSECGADVSLSNFRSDYEAAGLVADNWGDVGSVKVTNCWSNNYPADKTNTNGDRVKYTNCYTFAKASDEAGGSTADGVTVVSGSVKGESAKTTMPNLGWGTKWQTVDGENPKPIIIRVRNYKVTFDLSEVEGAEVLEPVYSSEGKITLPEAPEDYHWIKGNTAVSGEIDITENTVIKAELHKGGAATCKDKAVCEICGVSYGELSTTHGESRLVDVKTADCNEKGYTGDLVCSVCEQVLEKGKATDKTQHSFVNDECTNCGAAAPVSGDPVLDDGKYVSDKTEIKDSLITKTGESMLIALVAIIAVIYATSTALLFALNKKSRAVK